MGYMKPNSLNMKISFRHFILSAIMVLPVFLFAQATSSEVKPAIFKGHWTLQVNGGVTQYFGDLNKDDWFNKSLKFGYGGALGYQLSPVFGIRGQFVGGKLESEREDKNLRLNTDFWDAGLNVTVNINEIFADYNPDRAVSFYLFGGAGFTSFSSVTYDLVTAAEQQKSDGKENELFVPVGAGVEFRLAKKVSFNIEYGDHLTFKDKTLDFHDQLKARDHYSYASAGLNFKFGGPKDEDNDGIKDKEDQCPDRPGKVELFGCPDGDNDGIADDEDACPKDAGKLEFKGCPDTDNDGIPDKDDACPSENGSRELKGCPDKDKDGFADKDDKCPDQAGKKELNGCPDRDGDGIADNDDQCPDIAGLKTLGGCADKDNDGIADPQDKCPEVAGVAANNGCPAESGVLVNEVVYFNTDQHIVIAQYNQLLNKVAETLRDNPGIRISVEGHTDSRESKNYNMNLSEKRADYVIKFFTERGIDKARIVKGFFGETRPAADNATVEGMKLNRRVEIKSVK